MKRTLEDLRPMIGQTPLVKIFYKFKGEERASYFKPEWMNLSGSIKDRVAFGIIENAYKTGHAYTIVSDDGLDVLIHIGIDTVELEGEYFDSKISSGECLKKGDIIAYADIDKIMEKGFDPVCVVVVTNSDKLHNVDIKYGQCYSGDTVMEYEQK